METYLVTGASGYIASWITKYLLEQGQKVHGTVRKLSDTAKIGHLLALQEKHPGQLHLFEAELLNKESFRKPMEGCTVILHTASPFFISKIKDPQRDLITPALQGTSNVLELANEFPAIRRIVLTSSVAAVHSDAADIRNAKGGVFTEADWNTVSDVKHNPYQYSKTIAERKAWEIARNQDRWKLVVINPGFVMGPSLTKRVDSTSIDTMRSILNGKFKTGVPDLYFGIVDVRDVAKAHILAATREKASGRHLLVGNVAPIAELARLLKEQYPSRPIPSSTLPKFMLYLVGPFMGFSWRFLKLNYGIPFKVDHSWSIEDLGIEYTPLKTTLIDHAEQMIYDKIV
jgi:nucleoside-diphosphate-sugar epimerase